MRFLLLILLVPAVILACCLQVAGQGSLGDPVYTYDFGSGPNPGPMLSSSITNMSYTAGCPNDGAYTIVNSLNSSNNCHDNTWQDIPQDHTGNPDGYMMLINATVNPPGTPPNIFFTVPLPAGILCQNTTYRFSAWILNLIKQSVSAGTIDPDILFTVTAPDGTTLKMDSTGSIPPNDPSKSPWTQYGVTFNSLGYSTVIVSMINKANGGNGNDLVLDDISFSAYGPVINPPESGIGTNLNPCEGEYDQPSFTVFVPQGNYNKAQWQENINSAGWVDIPNETTNTLTINNEFQPAKTGTYQYRVGFAIGDNINSPLCRVYSPASTITVNPLPVVTGIQPSQSVCEGDVLTLTASGGTRYSWTGPDMQPNTANPLIIPAVTAANAGAYTVTAYSQYGCASIPATVKVTVFPKAHATAAGSSTICEGTSTPLTATGGSTYLWTPGSTLSDSTSASPMASPTDTTTYKVVVTTAGGCVDSASVTIDVLKKPVANAGPKRVIFAGQSVKLIASAQYSNVFSWTPVTGLSDPNILQPIASPASDTKYTLHATSSTNCGTDTSSVFIRVYQHITIPNTFSPNNDGINDTWNIDALVTYPQSVMLIFDRYGQQLFKSTGYSKPWDGTYNGKPVPTGTYYYVLDLKDNKPKIAGYVMVVR